MKGGSVNLHISLSCFVSDTETYLEKAFSSGEETKSTLCTCWWSHNLSVQGSPMCHLLFGIIVQFVVLVSYFKVLKFDQQQLIILAKVGKFRTILGKKKKAYCALVGEVTVWVYKGHNLQLLFDIIETYISRCISIEYWNTIE